MIFNSEQVRQFYAELLEQNATAWKTMLDIDDLSRCVENLTDSGVDQGGGVTPMIIAAFCIVIVGGCSLFNCSIRPSKVRPCKAKSTHFCIIPGCLGGCFSFLPNFFLGLRLNGWRKS
ncbi:MAG: hypothetical protein HPY74_03240 [Firmicutes bacterium]|nr:hypothetical protein [Bacillota bacterium]